MNFSHDVNVAKIAKIVPKWVDPWEITPQEYDIWRSSPLEIDGYTL